MHIVLNMAKWLNKLTDHHFITSGLSYKINLLCFVFKQFIYDLKCTFFAFWVDPGGAGCFLIYLYHRSVAFKIYALE